MHGSPPEKSIAGHPNAAMSSMSRLASAVVSSSAVAPQPESE